MRETTQGPLKEIYLAGGCFWGVEKAISQLNGVVSTECGYANGDEHFVPDYMLVCSGKYGYAETVKVIYDSDQLSVSKMLKAFFMIADPTALYKQGNDVGIQYRTGIYWTDDDTGKEVRRIVAIVSNIFPAFYTEAMPLKNYTVAEENHQKYLDKNPDGYCHIPFSIMDAIKEL
jgi:methionine-S-sulfoxide reductase